MTSSSFAPSGTEDHPEVSEISAHAEGLLPPERSTDIQSHLAECALCTDVRASLDEIRGALGTLPGPPQMPDDIAGRIDAALAAEALLSATAPEPPTGEVSRETGSPSKTPAPKTHTPETPAPDRPASDTTAGAQTTATLAGDTSTAVASRTSAPRDTRRPAGQPDAATGPGRRSGRRRRRRSTLLGAVGAVAALTLGSLFVPDLLSDSDGGTAQNAADSEREVSADKRDLTADSLEEKVHSLLAKAPEASVKGAQEDRAEGVPESGAEPSPTAPLVGGDEEGDLSATSLPACVQKGTGRDESPLAASRETYEGSAAYLVVLQHPDDQQRVSVYVIDARCVTQSPSDSGTVLTTKSYDRR